MIRTNVLVLAAVGLLGPQAVTGQTAAEQLQEGIAAYQALDYDTASRLLQGAAREAARLEATATEVEALTYHGATEIFRGQPDSAAADFRAVLLLDPRNRIDELTFPPEVTIVFDAARREMLTVALEVPEETVARPAGGELRARVFPTSPHTITVDLRGAASSRTDTIYRGPTGDSLEVVWDLRVAGGQPVSTNLYFLSVRSQPSADGVARVVTVPLDIELVRQDTLPYPLPIDDAFYLPEMEPGPRGLKALPLGFAAAAAVAVVPPLVAPGSNLSETRFLVVGAISIASLARVFNAPSGRPIPTNIEANAQRRQSWLAQRDSVIAENRSRLESARLIIRAGPPIISREPRR